MKDFVSKGEGKSRFLKSVSNFLTLYPDYETFVNALITGTLPVDFNGVNPVGVTEMGTPLNKATLLTDATATALELAGDDPTVDDALNALNTKAVIEVVSYVGTGQYGASNPCSISFSKAPKAVFFLGTGTGGTMPRVYDVANKNMLTPNSLTTSYELGRGFYYYGDGSYTGVPYAKISADGKSISWYAAQNSGGEAETQLNASGITYYFLGVW